jgi:hypothetical protein
MPQKVKREEHRDWFLRLPPDLYDELRNLATREDRSIASAVRLFVREGLERRREASAVI